MEKEYIEGSTSVIVVVFSIAIRLKKIQEVRRKGMKQSSSLHEGVENVQENGKVPVI